MGVKETHPNPEATVLQRHEAWPLPTAQGGLVDGSQETPLLILQFAAFGRAAKFQLQTPSTHPADFSTSPNPPIEARTLIVLHSELTLPGPAPTGEENLSFP